MTSPGAETSFTASANITIAADASDPDGTIAKVEFFEGPRKIGEDSSSPFAATWNNVPEGDYQIAAVAHDDQGATTRSADVSIHVRRLVVNSMRRLADGTVELTVSGAVGRTAYVYVSDDLEAWAPLTSVMNTTGTVVINDPAAATADRRFYRVSPIEAALFRARRNPCRPDNPGHRHGEAMDGWRCEGGGFTAYRTEWTIGRLRSSQPAT